MKKIIFFIALAFSLSSQAQTDTTKLSSSNLTLRAGDWEYVASFVAYTETFENLYDSIKLRLRFGTYPTSLVLVTVNSVTNGELVSLVRIIQSDYNGTTDPVITRIAAAIRAMNADPYHWVNRQLDAMTSANFTEYVNRRIEGKRRLRKL